MDSILLISILTVLFVIVFFMQFTLYNMCKLNYNNIFELAGLVTRTFREYYKGEDIEPVVINNGIDLIWKGDVEGSYNENNVQGFITIMTNEGNVNSPIKDTKEADILAGKIMNVVYDYIQDRELWSI